MGIIRCVKCDRPFDTDEQVEAEFLPLPVCEGCVHEREERHAEKQRQDWAAINMDWEWIANNF